MDRGLILEKKRTGLALGGPGKPGSGEKPPQQWEGTCSNCFVVFPLLVSLKIPSPGRENLIVLIEITCGPEITRRGKGLWVTAPP